MDNYNNIEGVTHVEEGLYPWRYSNGMWFRWSTVQETWTHDNFNPVEPDSTTTVVISVHRSLVKYKQELHKARVKIGNQKVALKELNASFTSVSSERDELRNFKVVREDTVVTVADVFIDELKANKVENLYGWVFSRDNEKFEITCRYAEGKTMATLLSELKKENAELKKENAELKDVIVANQVADETGYIDGEGWVDSWESLSDKATEIYEKHVLFQCIKGIHIYADHLKGAGFKMVDSTTSRIISKLVDTDKVEEITEGG